MRGAVRVRDDGHPCLRETGSRAFVATGHRHAARAGRYAYRLPPSWLTSERQALVGRDDQCG